MHVKTPNRHLHSNTRTILLELNGDMETSVRQHDSWQGLRKHHGKTQQPPPMNQHILTTAGQHTGHKDYVETDCCRLPFCASKHVASSRGCVGRWTWEQLSLHKYTHGNKHAQRQSRGSDYVPRRHDSLLWPVKHMHTHTDTHYPVSRCDSVHVSMCAGVCAREKIWKMSAVTQRRQRENFKERKQEEEMERGNRLRSITLRRREDCGAALKGIVPSQEVWRDRARGRGAQRQRERTRKRERRGGSVQVYSMNEREREKQHVGDREQECKEERKPIRGGDMREQWSED